MKSWATIACAVLGLGGCLPMQTQDPYATGTGAPPASGGEAEPAPDASSAPQSPEASTGPQSYSLDLKNECRETISLFIGDRPPYSSGTYTSLGANTSTSYSGFAPETIWIVDASRNPVSSYSVGAGSQRVQVLDSCSGFAPR